MLYNKINVKESFTHILSIVIIVSSLLFYLCCIHQVDLSNQSPRSLRIDSESEETLLVTVTKKNKKGSPQNILIVVADDQGYTNVGYEDPKFVTPTIDTLAESDVKLKRLFVHCQRVVLF